ncbi:hypothetical protein AgCh_031345 [Apium graveolens]
MDRDHFAYRKGNPVVTETRMDLLKCNDWGRESQQGYKQSDLASQCIQRTRSGLIIGYLRRYIVMVKRVDCCIPPENFDPIVDVLSGCDYIPSMVYGSTVVSAGLLRIFGRDLAELSLVATTKENQGKGYFQLLFSCIEKLLAFMSVRTLVLPATEEAETRWTKKFGFEKIPQEQLNNYRKKCWQSLAQETRNPDHRLLASVNNHRRQLATSLETVKWQHEVFYNKINPLRSVKNLLSSYGTRGYRSFTKKWEDAEEQGRSSNDILHAIIGTKSNSLYRQ